MSRFDDEMGCGEGQCGKTDAVLALFLDGDIGLPQNAAGRSSAEDSGFDFVCPESLLLHLRQCASCQQALLRGRRLDALLAENAGRAVAEAIHAETILGAGLARLCAVATRRVAEADSTDATADTTADTAADTAAETAGKTAGKTTGDTAPARTGTRARASLTPVPTLLLSACAVGLLWMLCADPVTAWLFAGDVDVARATPQIGSSESGGRQAGSPEMGAANATSISHIAVADDAARRYRPRPSPQAPADLDTLLACLCADDVGGQTTITAREHSEAICSLLSKSRACGANSAYALTAVTRALATDGSSADALQFARGELHFTAFLRAALRRFDAAKPIGLEDLAVLTVATRLASPDLDEAVQRAVRRRPELLGTIAAAMRDRGARDARGTTLLLDLWADAAARGASDIDLARRLFAGQPAARFEELLAELQATHSAPRRVQCLLGLAASPDAQCIDALVEWTTASCRTEAYAAAWSLSRMPHRWLARLAERAQKDPSAFLMRTALASAGLPAASAWTTPLDLSPEEKTVLATASLPLLPRIAEWFRDRPGARSAIAND